MPRAEIYKRELTRKEITELVGSKFDDLVAELRPFTGGTITIQDWRKLRRRMDRKASEIEDLIGGIA